MKLKIAKKKRNNYLCIYYYRIIIIINRIISSKYGSSNTIFKSNRIIDGIILEFDIDRVSKIMLSVIKF